MENNFLKDLLKQSSEFKKMQSDIESGKTPDITSAISFLTSMPNNLKEQFKGLKGENKKEADKLLKKIEKMSSLENIIKSMNNAD